MKRINEYKVSLMEKEPNFSVNKEGKGNYIIRSTASFKPEEYLKKSYMIESHQDEEIYNNFIIEGINLIFGELIKVNANKPFDSIRLWFNFEDGEEIENSIDYSILESIKEYGEEGIVPIKEFAKMTLPNEGEED